MVFIVFVFGVLAGMAVAALFWIGASTAALVVALGLLLVLSAVLSSSVAFLIAPPDEDPAVRTGRGR
ncbi:MAG: hypothetical protein MUF63_07915 [Rhodobacteraceae bacterium]|nr:hypothetical protein [Paracoccaceae bacterium]